MTSVVTGSYVLAGLILAVIITWIVSVPHVVRFLLHIPCMYVQTYPPQADGEPCVITLRDGTPLRASLLRARVEPSAGLVVFLHGLYGDRWNVAPVSDSLREAGWDILTVDARNHGENERRANYTPRPWVTRRDVRDAQDVIRHAANLPTSGGRGVAIIGISRGGNAALCATAKNPHVLALVTDGTFALNALLYHYIRRFLRTRRPWDFLGRHLPDLCLTSYCAWAKFFFRLKVGSPLASMERAARHIKQPVFLIHGERDGVVPLVAVHRLRRALAGRSKLWIVPGAKHNAASVVMPEAYATRIVRFLQRAARESEDRPAHYQPASPTQRASQND